MDFNPGEFQPFPVSHPNRPETPPLDFDISHPFTGIELIVSGLPHDSLSAAQNRLQHIIQELGNENGNMPNLDIVSPSSTDPLDYVWVSLAGPLKEVPRPDVLERIRASLDEIDGLRARWKASTSRMDKTRQVYFQAEEGTNMTIFKSKIDRVLLARHLDVQTSWVPRDGRRVFYMFLAHDAFKQLTNQPIEVDRRFYHPRHSRYIQPKFGLEVAVNGVGDLPQAKSLINRYLENTYSDGSGDPVVRDSRLELDGTVYCAVLRTPRIASRFVSEPFNLFSASGINVSSPQYLYVLNTQGVPAMVFNSNPSNSSQESNPLLQRQLDTLSANANSVNATLQQVIQQQKDTEDRYQRDRTNLIDAFRETTNVYYLTNLINSTQSEIMTLQTSIDHQESLKLLLPPNDPRVQGLDDRTARLQHRIYEAESHKKDLTTQLQAKQLTLTTSSPTATSFMEPVVISDQDQQMSSASPVPIASMPEASTSNKRPRLEDDQSDVRKQQEVELSMQVDDGLHPPSTSNG